MAERNCAATTSCHFSNIKLLSYISLALGICFLARVSLQASPPNSNLSNITHWSFDHSKQPHPELMQMVILDPDDHEPRSTWPPESLKIAAIDIDDVKDHWPMFIQGEIKRFLKDGFDGLLLKNIDDTSAESIDLWISQIRTLYPNIILLAEGLATLEKVAPHVDGLVVDGVFTTWDATQHQSRRTTQDERDARLNHIENALVRAPLPVFNVEYDDPTNPSIRRLIVEQSRAHKFHPSLKN